MSADRICFFALAVSIFLTPARFCGGQELDLTDETKVAMLIVKQRALNGEKAAEVIKWTEVHRFSENHQAYALDTSKIWVRYLDNPSVSQSKEENLASFGEGDELTLMDYSNEVVYIHQSGLHENEFYHVRITSRQSDEAAAGPEEERLFVEFLKAKVPQVGSVYPDRWNEEEEERVREAFGRKIKAFCVEFKTELTAGLNK